jgi:hypothetical protein
MRPAGCYSLDCYCDNTGNLGPDGRDPFGHMFREFPHNFIDETGGGARSQARKYGWLLDFKNDRYLCPRCNPKRRKI